ncbi:hypothetical protein [Enterococcus faecalis]|uniref:hypothetical protein n=1 Tax=Enterococcus faecalis TaxID=1351 RepID=UPI002DBFA26F|nr:hypothetical protein [Enterococcus faecalis]MEB7954692.1 hypothetical protein [Enterococcus faecalis]MEB7964851.1 hypothetical protein [Enterococcus faecalis]
MKKKMYRITTDPRDKQSELLINPTCLEDASGNVLAMTISNDCIETGMYSNIDEIIKSLKDADIIFTLGDIDKMSFFELGLATALKRNIYVVTLNESLTTNDLGLSFEENNFKFVSPEEFSKLMDIV